MKKSIFIIAFLALGMVSCDKFSKDDKSDNMIEFAARYGQTVVLPSTDYVAEVTETLERADDTRPYNSGTIEYRVNGQKMATIDFGHGNEMEAQVSKDGTTETVSLGESNNGDKEDYDKVIVEPLVYSEECGYVISGVIKFFKDGKWVVTFDYGDGTCDDLISKTTEDYVDYMFSMDDYPEWNK